MSVYCNTIFLDYVVITAHVVLASDSHAISQLVLRKSFNHEIHPGSNLLLQKQVSSFESCLKILCLIFWILCNFIIPCDFSVGPNISILDTVWVSSQYCLLYSYLLHLSLLFLVYACMSSSYTDCFLYSEYIQNIYRTTSTYQSVLAKWCETTKSSMVE